MTESWKAEGRRRRKTLIKNTSRQTIPGAYIGHSPVAVRGVTTRPDVRAQVTIAAGLDGNLGEPETSRILIDPASHQ
jgi:hypothetical protein